MGIDFVAIDFETANFSRASACAVGVVRVVGGGVVERSEWFIDPPGGRVFTNTFIHGITEKHVNCAPSWVDTLARLDTFCGDLPLVAYSGFDRGVYNAANRFMGTSDPGFAFLNAHSLARRKLSAPDYTLEDYRLPTVVRFLGIGDFEHHRALADAEACAAVVLKVAALDGHQSLDALWPAPGTRVRSRVNVPRGPLPKSNVEADPAHPLYGASVCFTGKLDSFTQAGAEQIAADFGATIENNVTKRTTLVVVGQFDPSHLKEGAKISNKAARAQLLATKGQRVEIIAEDGFLDLINLDQDEY